MFQGGNCHCHGSVPPEYVILLASYNYRLIDLVLFVIYLSSFRTQSERREFNDELKEGEFDDEVVGREYDPVSELFEREPEPLFAFIKLVVQ